MKITNPVVVMALYDIGRDNWPHFNLSYQTYLFWMKNTLSLDCKLVIYTESKFIIELTNYRKEFDPNLEKTVIIDLPLNELPMYNQYYGPLKTLMDSDNFKSKVSFPDVPEMSQPLYNIIMFNKVFFLKDTIEKKYFNNDMVIWADAGGLRESITQYKDVNWPNIDKVNDLDNSKITFFSHNSEFDVPKPHRESYSLSQIRNIQGTSFLLPSNLINELLIMVTESIDESINNGYIGSDEKIFDIAYSDNKNIINLIKCGWREYFDILK
jgi:hypothetical protein